jgi:type I restriction enzyme S subunit
MSSVVPEGWTKERLGNHVKLESGNAFQSLEFSDKGTPIVRISNIRNDKIDLLNVVYYQGSNRLEKFLIADGDILLAMSGATTGKIGKYTYSFKSYLNQRVGRFKIIDETKSENEYIYQLVRSREFAENTLIDAIGGAQPNISSSQVENVVYKFPPLPEQKKIASILTSVDEVIENTQKQIDKLQDLKKATMNELLTKGIGHTEFKDSELGRIPKSWEVYSVQELLDNGTLLTMKDGNHGAQYPRSSEFQRSGVPFLAASSISEEGAFEIDQLPCLSSERAKSLRIPCAIGGDVILTHNATVGRVTIIPQDVKEIIVSTSTTYYRVNGKSMSNEYLKCFLEGNPFQSQLQRVMGQTTRNQVPITAQRLLSIALPPTLDEQMHISQVISSLSRKLATNAIKLQKTKSLKKSLMQDLLTGKVRVTVN